MKKALVIILILVAGFILWKREPWVKTYRTEAECEAGSVRNSCQMWQCNNIGTTFWLDCPHGNEFWKPIVPRAL